jgi:hypothetical protein
MAIFHVVGKPNFTILVGDSRVLQVIENVLCAMFVFQKRSMHVSKDVAHAEDNVVFCSLGFKC